MSAKWYVRYDGLYSHISRQGRKHWSDNEYDTFPEARKELVQFFKSRLVSLKWEMAELEKAIKKAKRITPRSRGVF